MLHVIVPAPAGGLERVVEMLASGQGGRAHVAAVVTHEGARGHPFVQYLRERGIGVSQIVVRGRVSFGEYRALSGVLRDVRPDVVHTHGYRADIVGTIAARRAGVPTVSTAHGFIGGGMRARMYEKLQCRVLRHADAVIAVSRPLVQRLVAEGVRRERVRHVPNSYEAAAPVVDRADARRQLGLDPDALVAGWVGRLSPEKGPDVMIAALSTAEPAWRLSIIGEGRERESLARLATELGVADRITWHGRVPRAGSLMAAFDAFVLSSRSEGTPITLFEAMAAGVPIVTTNVGGVPDVVTQAEAIVVPPGLPAALAEGLAAIRRDRDATMRRSVAARHRASSVYGVAPWLAAVDAAYEAAIASRRRRRGE